MTIWFPDLSNHEGMLTLETGTVVVCSKTTEGNYFVDGTYQHYINEAHRVGAPFFGYHFLRAGNIQAQAQYLKNHDLGYPQMLDIEAAYGTCPSYQDCLNFTKAYRALGGTLNDWYLPHWVWASYWGSPDLSEARSLGIFITASDYTTYSDNGPGWASYGGIAPKVWQYTDALNYSGTRVDFNAFKGTVSELSALLGAKVPSGPVPVPVPSPVPAPSGTYQYRATHNTYTPIAVDHSWGPKTTQALQFVLGVQVDGAFGLVSKRALQKLLAVRQDGIIGPETVKALQRKVGATVDGNLGPQTVGKLQEALNAGKLY
jgi:peptidoglycan hydrolase-like protein with peptidoglycan-binding domain